MDECLQNTLVISILIPSNKKPKIINIFVGRVIAKTIIVGRDKSSR